MCLMEKPENSYFTADWHLYHHNIIGYCNRPFKSTADMHKTMQKRNNNIVGPDDVIWNIGDVCIAPPEYVGRIRKQVDKFNGLKHLVLGNHDEWKAKSYGKSGFMTTHTAMWFRHKGLTFYMMHDPAEFAVVQNDPSAVMLCGHVHNLFKHLLPEKRVINVGVDVWDFKPVSLEQILLLLEKYGVL